MKRLLLALASLAGALSPGLGRAEDYVITLRDGRFSPPVLTVPAGKKLEIAVRNQDATQAEFESVDLDREKIVDPNGEVLIFIGPLDPGSYGYFDDFHRATTGTIVAK